MYITHTLPRLIRDARPWVPTWRGGQTIYVDGKPVQRNPTRFFIRALVVPVTGSKQMLMPEGDRLTERYTVYQDYSQTRLAEDLANDPLRLCINDKLNLFSNSYIVEEAKDWGSYIEATVTRVDVGNKQPVDFPQPPDALP